MERHETPEDGAVRYFVEAEDTRLWPRQWPCSKLAGTRFYALFIYGDLVDFDGPEDVESNELTACIDWLVSKCS